MLGALRERLMDPDIFKVLVSEFTAEWNRLQADASAGLAAQSQELDRVRSQIERLMDALTEGAPAVAVRARMEALEARRLVLERELAPAEAPAPRLHPNLAEVYRRKLVELSAALAGDDAAEARELVRGLVEQIRLVPEGGKLRIEVRGELGAILRLAEGAQNQKRPGGASEAFMVQVKMDAGTRNRRCQYIEVAI